MRAVFFASAFAAAAVAQSSGAPSSSVDAHPQTTFLQQTNSLGVVTGQPAVVTSIPSQPAADSSQAPAVTSVGLPASIPAVYSGINTVVVGGPGNSTRTLVVSANNSTTIVLNGTPTGSGASATGSDASATGSSGASRSGSSGGTQTVGASGSQSTGAAATMRAVAGGLVGAGAFVAAFL